jgi:hypothetical protein
MPLTRARIGAFLQHPLFLLCAGSALGSVIIPALTSRAADRRLQAEARQQTALEVLDHGFEVDRNFNAVRTRVESFIDQRLQARDPLTALQPELRSKFDDLYQDFDKTAWWWFWQDYHKAQVLDLLSNRQLRSFESLNECYRLNLVVSTGDLSHLRDVALASAFGAATATSAQETHARLDQITSDRDVLVQEMAALFTGKQPAIADEGRMMRPGRWVETRAPRAPGTSPAASADDTRCWSAADVENARSIARKIEPGKTCKISDLRLATGQLSWSFACADGSAGSAKLTLCGALYRATVTRTVRAGSGSAAGSEERLTARRIGDCP